jgi:hypothetical protein
VYVTIVVGQTVTIFFVVDDDFFLLTCVKHQQDDEGFSSSTTTIELTLRFGDQIDRFKISYEACVMVETRDTFTFHFARMRIMFQSRSRSPFGWFSSSSSFLLQERLPSS